MTDADFADFENSALAALPVHQRLRTFVRDFRESPEDTKDGITSIGACSLSEWLDVQMPKPFRALALYEKTQAAHRGFDAIVAGRTNHGFARAASPLKSYLKESLTYARLR